jgi:hypothetical protein
MLRKTLIALSAAAALGVTSGAMAAGHGGHGSSGAMQGHSGGMQGRSAQSFGGTIGQSQVRPMSPSQMQTTGPRTSSTLGPRTSSTLGPRTSSNNWGRHHHHRHDRFFFGAGFAGPYYDDYGYDSCWRIVPTYGGWQRVWVCGDYPYWGY